MVKMSRPNNCPKTIAQPIETILEVPPKLLTSLGKPAHVGVRDLVARGYFISGGASQRGWWSGAGVPCRTLSDLDWVRLGCLIAMGFDNRTITFRIDHTHLHRIAVRFEWALYFGKLLKNPNNHNFGFGQTQNRDFGIFGTSPKYNAH